jgi:hypothetical protein
MVYAVHSEQRRNPICVRLTRRLSGGARFRMASVIGAMVIMGFGISAATAHVAPPAPDVVASDLAHRSPDIHWPDGFSPEIADMFSHNEIMIHVNCSIVLRHLVVRHQQRSLREADRCPRPADALRPA